MEDIFTTLTTAELELSSKLKTSIVAAINDNHGDISFSRYMHMALYDTELGYYNNLLHKFGKGGDFITSPTLSSLFGKSIARQISQLFLHVPKNNILEIGAGNGDLMLDILANIGEQVEHYYILELSTNLIEYQKNILEQKYPRLANKVIWVSSLPVDFIGVVLANEVLDAQPCELVHWRDDGIYICNVGLSGNDFVYKDVALLESDSEIAPIAAKLPIPDKPYISEINLNNRGFIKSLADSIHTGCILLVDYGYSETEYYAKERNTGTLRGFFRHHLLEDILIYPGLIDITCSVDFTSVAETAISNQLDHIGYTTQANFLLNCGVLEIMAQLQNDLTDGEYLVLSNQLNKLTSPNHMGDIFKVIGFSKNIGFSDWLGFTSGDRSHTL